MTACICGHRAGAHHRMARISFEAAKIALEALACTQIMRDGDMVAEYICPCERYRPIE